MPVVWSSSCGLLVHLLPCTSVSPAAAPMFWSDALRCCLVEGRTLWLYVIQLIRLVIVNHCVMKHPDTNRATWFMLISSVIKALKVGDTTQPNTGAPAPQDRTHLHLQRTLLWIRQCSCFGWRIKMFERGAKEASLLTWKSIRTPSVLGASTQGFTAIHTHQPMRTGRVQTPLLMHITRNPELGHQRSTCTTYHTLV